MVTTRRPRQRDIPKLKDMTAAQFVVAVACGITLGFVATTVLWFVGWTVFYFGLPILIQ